MSKNFLIAAYRKLQQRLQSDLSHAEGDALHDAFCKLWVADYHPSQIEDPPPDNEVEDTYKRIWELIKTQLTPLQQDILKRHDVNDETYSEIADRLGMQEAAVRMQLSRARKKIREIYKKTRK